MSAGARRALVVGAGLAGLAAAVRLRASGVEVTVVDARARAGGKHALETLDGLSYAPWPALLPRSAPAFAGLRAELGSGAALERAPLARVGWLRGAHVRTGSLELARALGPSPLAAPRARRLVLLTSWLGDPGDPETPEADTRLDDRSVADFCRVYLGRRVLDERLAPLFATLFGVDTAAASRQLLFALLEADATLALDRLGRADLLVETLAARAGALRLGARAVALTESGATLENGESLRADAVVLAVPPEELARLLPNAPHGARLALERTRTRATLTLAVVTGPAVAPPAPLTLLPPSEGGELAGVVDVTPAGERDRNLLLLVARPDLAARHGHRPDAELAHFLIESGARVVPGLEAGVRAQRLHRHAPPSFGVGHYRELARLREALPLALAGDWLASAPHVEGELASGLRAARELSARASRS